MLITLRLFNACIVNAVQRARGCSTLGHEENVTVLLVAGAGAAPVTRERVRRTAHVLKTIITGPMVVRLSARWLHATVFHPVEWREARAAAEALGGRLAGLRRGTPEPRGLGEAARCLRGLVEANLFWEAHTVGEYMWRRRGVAGRAAAVLAGAFAKVQEGELAAAKAMLAKAVAMAREAGVRVDAELGTALLEELALRGWVRGAWRLFQGLARAAAGGEE